MKNKKGITLPGALLVVLAVIIVGMVAAVICYVSAANSGNAMEQNIKATYENNKNVLAQFGQKVLEAAQVPEMARDDISAVASKAMQGRYGADGSKAVFQAIQEQNPQVDPVLHRQVQQIIESGRAEFQNDQTRLIDQKRVYETALGSVWQGMWMRMAGYPKINLDEFKIVGTDRSEQAFKNGKESSPIQLRPAKQ